MKYLSLEEILFIAKLLQPIDNNCIVPFLYNNSYADSTISGYRYGDVFVEETTKSKGIACSGYANCYIGCSCNTSNGWYSSCSSTGGSDCKSVTDTRYTGVNALSASNVSDVTSLTDGKSALSTSGDTQVVSLSGGVSTMSSSGATTCYKKKTCSEGGYYSYEPADKNCYTKNYNGYNCYYSCSYKTCSDYGYKASIPSGQTCTTTYPRSGLTCYKDCKNNCPNGYTYDGSRCYKLYGSFSVDGLRYDSLGYGVMTYYGTCKCSGGASKQVKLNVYGGYKGAVEVHNNCTSFFSNNKHYVNVGETDKYGLYFTIKELKAFTISSSSGGGSGLEGYCTCNNGKMKKMSYIKAYIDDVKTYNELQSQCNNFCLGIWLRSRGNVIEYIRLVLYSDKILKRYSLAELN